ncbi:O-antigen ligase family protein [Pyxidicoccus sp. MSG2]|uniref:O-antigen ligase family protein n=1 Tax=Pyxidicoccus sp. MSG2 TaxID=2996790 RepID=UPI00226F9A97|nr:O-antigen ligase family protein [Pyxidicoccus sp. MSG2]MCY1022982.1 O-antigen ligase family protein [Pyxidicoccus sp. MSG2]
MVRATTALLVMLFVAIIVDQLAHTRRFWLLAVFLGLFLLSRSGMKRPFFALAFAMPFLSLGTSPVLYMIAPTLEMTVQAFLVLWLIRAAQGRASLPEAGPVDGALLLFLLLATGSATAAATARVLASGDSLSGLGPAVIAFRTSPYAPLFPLRELFIFLEGILLFSFVRANLSREDLEPLAILLLGSALGVLLVGVFILWKIDQTDYFHGVNRATGVFSGPNQFGTYLLMTLPVAVVLARTARWPMARWLALLVAGGGVVMLFLSRSQGAWLAALAAPVLSLLFFHPTVTRPIRGGRLLAAGLLVSAVALGGFLLATRTPEQLNALSDGRYFLFRAGLGMVIESPLVGVGLGNFFQFVGDFYPAGISGRAANEHAHNMYLQLLAELGPLGLAAFVLPIAMLLARATRPPGQSPLGRALLVGVLAVLLHSLFDYTLWIASISLIFWMYLGVLASVLDGSGEHAPARRPRFLAIPVRRT